MYTTSLYFLIFFCSSLSFFLSFFFYISSFFLCPFSFFFPFLLSLLFSRSSCFLFSFISLSVYRTRAHAYARVLGFDTHGGVVKKAFRCAVFETLFFCAFFLWLSEPPPPFGVVCCLFGFRFCVSFLFVFVPVMPRPLPPFPSFVFLAPDIAPRFAFFSLSFAP